MLKSIRTLIIVSAGISAFYLSLPSLALGAGTSSGNKPKEETYIVVKEGEEYKVITASSYNDEVKRLNEDNKKKMDEWHDLIKSDNTTPRPKKIIPKKMPITFKTQKGAQEYADKLLEKDGKNDKSGVPAKS